MDTLERPRNGCRKRLLPATPGFAILEHFAPADKAVVVEMKGLPFRFSPKHEGCVAVPSPSDSDWTVRHLVLYAAVLRKDCSRVSLGNIAVRNPNQDIALGKESGLRSRDELRMIHSGIRHGLGFCILRESRTRTNNGHSRTSDELYCHDFLSDGPLATRCFHRRTGERVMRRAKIGRNDHRPFLALCGKLR